MVLEEKDIEQSNCNLGGKTTKLKDLQVLGFVVPKFIAIDSLILQNATDETGMIKKDILQELITEIVEKLPVKKYAIRSSAIVEDGQSESLAGQFLTKINVEEKEIGKAINEVVSHAYKYLDGRINQFSLLIQEYIEPEMAGIVFTRNPLGSREMIFEYHEGRGEKVVGGKVRPDQISVHWSETVKNNKLPDLRPIIEQIKKAESFFNFPQDLEWCIKNGKWFFLQTRPITTLRQDQFEEFLYLDKELPKEENYYYEKTEISEIAPRPCRITIDLMNKIYGENGPIEKAYKDFGITYKSADFLKIIGNELFIDRELEIKTLLPSYSYFKNTKLQPQIEKLADLGMTFKNISKLSNISPEDPLDYFEKILIKFSSAEDADNIEKWLNGFLEDYRLIFKINLFAGLALKKLSALLNKTETVDQNKILSFAGEIGGCVKLSVEQVDFNNILGNSLDVADETEFMGEKEQEFITDKVFSDWWNNLPEWRKKTLEGPIQKAYTYNRLRELGRWLVVKEVCLLRNILITIAKKNHFKNIKNIYFAHLKEVSRGNVDEAICIGRKDQYLKFKDFNFPCFLSNFKKERDKPALGISGGEAKGVLISVSEIDNYKGTDAILCTKILSPDLTRHFDKIIGIVSENGGVLSHLAIIAREKKIPVIVDFNFESSDFKIGDNIKINGANGQISKL